jgi:arylsulfatase A-like enzyme
MDAHWPYIPPSPFDKLYPGKDKDFNTNRYTTLRDQIHNYKRFKRKVTDEEHNHLVSQYDGGIAYIDFHIGKLLALLKTIGQYENTMIIITSDHGEAFGERNFMEHNCSVYQDQVYVPLIIKYPNTNKSIVVNELAHSVDIMPTVLGVLGYEIPVNLQGQNLLRDKRKKQSFVISERYPRQSVLPRFNSTKRAIFSEEYKFISSTTGKRELYDLSKDPNEKKNLYDVNGSKSMELEAKLNQWLKITKEEPSTATKLDKDALESLKALGYIQ